MYEGRYLLLDEVVARLLVIFFDPIVANHIHQKVLINPLRMYPMSIPESTASWRGDDRRFQLTGCDKTIDCCFRDLKQFGGLCNRKPFLLALFALNGYQVFLDATKCFNHVADELSECFFHGLEKPRDTVLQSWLTCWVVT